MVRKTRRGGGCAAMPTNSALVQRGGMAPISYPGLLLDASAREQAQMGPLDKAFAELPSVIPTSGGRRKHQSRKQRRHQSRKQRRHQSRKQRRQRQQRGGVAPYDDAYTFSPNFTGQNPQWQSVSNVGAQAPGPIDVV